MSAQQIYTDWVLILAAIGPLAIAIGWGMALGFGNGIRFALACYVILLVMTALQRAFARGRCNQGNG